MKERLATVPPHYVPFFQFTLEMLGEKEDGQ